MKKVLLLLILIMLMIASYKNTNENAISKTSNEYINASKIENNIAYLTFDDGPSQNTEKVLKILDKYKIKATFFVIGNQIDKGYEKQLKQMEKDGHKIGIHTYEHDYKKIYASTKAYIDDFDKTNELLVSILKSKPDIYRFPGGSTNCYIGSLKSDIIEILSKRGYKYYDWNVSGEDSVNNPTAMSIKKNVYRHYKSYDKTIILLHDSAANDNTIKALPDIIEKIKLAGYSFDTLKNNK